MDIKWKTGIPQPISYRPLPTYDDTPVDDLEAEVDHLPMDTPPTVFHVLPGGRWLLVGRDELFLVDILKNDKVKVDTMMNGSLSHAEYDSIDGSTSVVIALSSVGTRYGVTGHHLNVTLC